MRVLLAILATVWGVGGQAEELVVGSKRFTESYILAEIAAQTARAAGQAEVSHKQGMGNTAILFEALKSGSVHLYPDYTGTIALELLKIQTTDLNAINAGLKPMGLGVAVKLGFENTYALAVREEEAQAKGLQSIAGLADQPALRFGLSHEFLKRSDGWPGLQRAYSLPQSPMGLDHGIAYEAMAAKQIDVMDIYSTDAKIARYKLKVLTDDKRYFPEYQAVFVYRLDVPEKFSKAWKAITGLEGRIDAAQMIAMNAAAELDAKPFTDIAREYLSIHEASSSSPSGFWRLLFGDDFWRLTAQHLMLVFGSLAAAVAIGIPLGICAARIPGLEQPLLAGVAIVQTVPSLALLAVLIAFLGTIGVWPALVALFLYALLPIVRGTHGGLAGISTQLRESAEVLGLNASAKLRLIDLPLASPSIFSGIKTAAVINVGTATIAAFIGAGGYGERIVTGLALNNHEMLWAGAIPAAILAVAVQWLFDGLQRVLTPRGLRTGP
ncbi:MAG: ABC transporter permease subunit [Betaproteobacteria bacterium]|nr:ABC transporter permease subunit [Betaproteobacteria bacterium]